MGTSSKALEEMATINFGKHSGKDHTQTPNSYLQWMQQQLAQGKSGFNVTDQGRRLEPAELKALLSKHLSQPSAPTSVPAPRLAQPARPQVATKPGMQEAPSPGPTWRKLASKFDDREGRYKAGDPIWWDSKTKQTRPALVPIGSAEGGSDINDPSDGTDPGDIGTNPNSFIKSDKKHGRPSPQQVRIPPQNMTPYNTNIQNKFVGTNEDIMIDALAGTGKTTMLKHLSSFIKPGEKWLYLVFNTKNKDEASETFPEQVTVMTTHGFLGDILKRADRSLGGGTQLRVGTPGKKVAEKIREIADKVTPPNWPETTMNWSRAGIERSPFHARAKYKAVYLAGLAKAYGLNPTDPNIEESILKLIESYNFDMDCSSDKREVPPDEVEKMTQDIIRMAIYLLNSTLPGQTPNEASFLSRFRDQDDTLWYAAIYADKLNWRTPYNVILMDEVQDFNMCQIKMAEKLRQAGHRVVAVGDPNQSMYRFRGTDAHAFERLKSVIGQGNAESLPINFRSGGNIIDWVKNNTDVKNLQAADHLEGKGEVWANGGTHPPVKYNDFMGILANEAQNGAFFSRDCDDCQKQCSIGINRCCFSEERD